MDSSNDVQAVSEMQQRTLKLESKEERLLREYFAKYPALRRIYGV
jgi:hypothetical protein